MFTRSPNASLSASAGESAPEPAPAAPPMRFWYRYVDPSHARLPGKPLVDVSAPLNALDEAHQSRRFGVQKVAYGFLSLNEFTGAREEVPYTESHHTSEVVRLWCLAVNVWFVNNFLARAQSSGNATGNPRTRFAWALALAAGWLRANAAAVLGAGGYFYSYEWLYTKGPWPFRLRDPSPNGWKCAWADGQDAYAARAAASVFPPLGYALFMGRWKKTGFWFFTTLAVSLYYEYARRNITSGSRLFYSYIANQETTRQAAWGSLAPNMKHRVDPDTHKNESTAQFKHFRITSGTMQNTIWENATHENLPLLKSGKQFPNPYFNWQKAPQNYNAKPWKVKNDMWEMPQVLNSQMRAGALDS